MYPFTKFLKKLCRCYLNSPHYMATCLKSRKACYEHLLDIFLLPLRMVSALVGADRSSALPAYLLPTPQTLSCLRPSPGSLFFSHTCLLCVLPTCSLLRMCVLTIHPVWNVPRLCLPSPTSGMPISHHSSLDACHLLKLHI